MIQTDERIQRDTLLNRSASPRRGEGVCLLHSRMAPATSAYSHSEILFLRMICKCVLSANSKPEVSIALAPGRSDGACLESWPNEAELIHLPHDCEKQGRSLNCGNAKKWMKPVDQTALRRDRGRGMREV